MIDGDTVGNDATDPRASHTGSDEEARAQLARVVESRAFASAPVLRRLLTFLVERTLDGHGDSLKEYVIGTAVFDRGESFDPRIDTIVRVQARRLRARLADYYATEGRVDPIRITLPVGRLHSGPDRGSRRSCAGHRPAFSRGQDGVRPRPLTRGRHGCRLPERHSSAGNPSWAR